MQTDLTQINRISQDHIRAAGPRYTPILDPNAPNLTIQSLLDAIEALGLTDRYREGIVVLEKALTEAWKESSKDTIALLSQEESVPALADALAAVRRQKAGQSRALLVRIGKLCKRLIAVLSDQEKVLWGKERAAKEDSEERRMIDEELSSIRRLERALLQGVKSFIESASSRLIINNRMLILGEWGTGKTHFLCDITRDRITRKLPTLFLLAYRLPAEGEPLEAVCKATKIARDQEALLKYMDRLGKYCGCRALIIIDGINEANRSAWRKHAMKIAEMVRVYPNVGFVISCRSPFDKQIFTSRTRHAYTETYHHGFQEIEFDAQRSFFEYYGIPNPHIPLLTPEFSRPLFLKILCLTFSGRTSRTKSRWICEIAAGQKSMTKLFEDFVNHIGAGIEKEFKLQAKTCWHILKGHTLISGRTVGIAVSMAASVKDYLLPKECHQIIKQVTEQRTDTVTHAIFNKMITEGLLSEDIIWESGSQTSVIRLPYQRFSDHLIARHLIEKYLDTNSENEIRRSFYCNRPLGKIFQIDKWGRSYSMPGLASAIMLEFPERVKRILPAAERELVFYLPKKNRLLSPLVDVFLDGLLWRNKDSFSSHTDYIVGVLLDKGAVDVQRRSLEALVSLACRPGHPYSSNRLQAYLGKMTLVERDLLWSEFLRNSYSESVVYRLLDWVGGPGQATMNEAAARSITVLLSLSLTSTDRAFRDRVTRLLVLIGNQYPNVVFDTTLQSLGCNDPYIPERMLAASYGTLMQTWAFPSSSLRNCVSTFARKIYDAMFVTNAPHSTSHILMIDYAIGTIELARRIDKSCLGRRLLSNLRNPFRNGPTIIPAVDQIQENECERADSALYMDFANYTIGRLVTNRNNYDSQHMEYRGVLRQIKWRILDLGYKPELFDAIDRSIAQHGFYQEQRRRGGKTDRYGKKYSWIAFYEVAGMRAGMGLLPDRREARISDVDIDPSFPRNAMRWTPPLKPLFGSRFRSNREWAASGDIPSYNHLIKVNCIDGISGPWILLRGFVRESAPGNDPRHVRTFLNGLLINPLDIKKFQEKFGAIAYPGNHAIPEPMTDYYTFAGEIPWSCKFGYQLRNKRCKPRRYVDEAFDEMRQITFRKRYRDLTAQEKFMILPRRSILGNNLLAREKPEQIAEREEATPPEYVEIPKYVKVHGIAVEIPVHIFGWEGYHSTENESDISDFPAPSLCQSADLRGREASPDLFDPAGKVATLYRKFGDDSEYFHSTLFYIREDILRSYLKRTRQQIVWANWGERDFKHTYLGRMRTELQDIWSSHSQVFKNVITGIPA